MSEEQEREKNSKPSAPGGPPRKIRFLDYFYYYLDYFFKILSELVQDVSYFFERIVATALARIFLVVSIFFINPLTENRSVAGKIILALPRIIIGLFLLIVLCLTALLGFLIGGTLSGIFGFRNIADYTLKEQIAVWLPLIVLVIAAPHFLSDFWIYKISMFFCFTLILVGFNFLYGQCGILTLGHGGFVLYGAFMTAFLYTGSFGFKLPFFISMVIASGTSFLLGLLLGLPSLRIKDYYLVIVTLAFMLAIPQILTSKYLVVYSGTQLGGLSIDQVHAPSFFSWMSQSTWNYFFVIGPALALIIFAYNLMHHSQIGRAFRTIKCDVEVSLIMGIPVIQYKLLAFAMSALYASIAGSLIMYLNRFISTDSYTINDSIDYIVAAVVGGPASILGCTVGGLFLTFEKDISSKMSTLIMGGDHLTRMFYGILMILVVFIAPQGIAGEITKKLKSKFIGRPMRGKYYISPPPDYDFLEMKGTTIKKD